MKDLTIVENHPQLGERTLRLEYSHNLLYISITNRHSAGIIRLTAAQVEQLKEHLLSVGN